MKTCIQNNNYRIYEKIQRINKFVCRYQFSLEIAGGYEEDRWTAQGTYFVDLIVF